MTKIPISFGQFMGKAAEAAPILLLLSMLACFGLIGYTQFLFYSKEFARGMGSNAPLMGGLVACMIQLCRLASGLSSSLHYKRGNIFSAIAVFCFSVGLSFWEWKEINHLAITIGGESSLFLLQFCVIVSLALEFGLASTIENEPALSPNPEPQKEAPEVSFSANGSGRRKVKNGRS